MTETRNCEFDHNNHPKKITTEELKDGFPGLPSSGDEVGLSGLCSYGDEDDKGGILEDGFSVLPSSVDEVGLSGLCSCGAEDDKGGILEDGLSGFTSYGDGDVKGGILGDGLSGLGCYGDEDVKGEIFDDGLSGFTSYGDEDVKGGILEDGLSGLGCYGDEDGKGGILKDGFSGFTSYGDEDVKGGILEDGLSGLCSYGVEDVKGGILEDGFAEKVKKGRICELRDPLVVLGSDIMLVILSCLDARSVALCLLVSCGWRAVASSDRIWSSKCEELWQGKTHLPRIAKVNELSKLAVYSWSVMDGKRKRIRKEDLHDHVWEFHFTEAAPQYWRMLDPYWNGTGPLMRRYFLPDGSHTAEPDDKIWGGHESCYCIITSLLADGKIRKHYVRINRWPPMYVKRKEDWSWEMSNDLCTYRSIPDADKEDGTGPLFLLY